MKRWRHDGPAMSGSGYRHGPQPGMTHGDTERKYLTFNDLKVTAEFDEFPDDETRLAKMGFGAVKPRRSKNGKSNKSSKIE